MADPTNPFKDIFINTPQKDTASGECDPPIQGSEQGRQQGPGTPRPIVPPRPRTVKFAQAETELKQGHPIP